MQEAERTQQPTAELCDKSAWPSFLEGLGGVWWLLEETLLCCP